MGRLWWLGLRKLEQVAFTRGDLRRTALRWTRAKSRSANLDHHGRTIPSWPEMRRVILWWSGATVSETRRWIRVSMPRLSLPTALRAAANCRSHKRRSTYSDSRTWSSTKLGNFIVTWVSVVGTGDELVDSVQARQFAADGVALSDEFTISTLTDSREYNPQIGMDDAGNFTIVWEALTYDSDPLGIMARRFDISGAALDSAEFLVNTTAGDAELPSIDVNATGEFVVVWDGFDLDTFSYNVFARRFAADGTPQGDDFLVNEEMLFDVYQDSADVALADDGSFVVVWESDNNPNYDDDVMLRRFDPNGEPLDSEFVIAGPIANSPTARISMAADGIYVVTWTDNGSGGIVGQRFASDGALIGSVFVVNDSTVGTQNHSSVSVGPMGTFVVGWLDLGSDGERVLVERFTADNPSVGIKAEGAQTPMDNMLPLWVDGSVNPFVGSGMSTKILIVEQVRQAVFAVDEDSDEIHQLDPDTAAIVRSVPLPESISGDAGLAFAGQTLYFVSDAGTTLYELDPASGAITDEILLADLGITDSVNGLAYLNGAVVAQAAASNKLYFIDPFENTLNATVTTAVSLVGGLSGAGSRGTLFAVESGGDIVEINPADGSVINNFAPPFSAGIGLAFIEGYLWVGDAAGQVSKVDPDTGTEVASWSTTIAMSALGGDDGGAVQTAVRGNYRPFVGTVLDDEADISITAGEGPFTGRFVPIEPLSHFDNSSVFGSWTLEIQDTATGDEGELTGWKLIVNNPNDTPPDFQYTSNLGDDSPNGNNDIDLYQVDVMTAGTITVEVQPGSTLDSVVRVFDASGSQLGLSDTPGLGTLDTLAVMVPAAGSYLVGISSSANTGYSPLDGSGAVGGTSSGSYHIALSFDHPMDRDDDNSSFGTATDFGVLGQAGQTVFAEIRNPPLLLNMPGSILEPGHREIPVESHYSGSGTGGLTYVPDRLLIRFTAETSAAQRNAILAQRGLNVVKDFSGTLLVEGPSGMDVLAQTRDLVSNQAVAYVEPDYILAYRCHFPERRPVPAAVGPEQHRPTGRNAGCGH